MRRNFKIALLAVLSAMMLSGCSSIELENRNFPLIIALDKIGDSYQVELGFENLAEVADQNAESKESAPVQTLERSWHSAFSESNANNPKTIDYNHAKVIVMSKSVLDDKDMLREFLEYVEKQNVIARNTLVFSSENESAEVMSLNGKLEMPLGTYLEELIAGQRMAKEQAAVTIGTLMNELYNRRENIYIPIVKVEEEQASIEEYYVLSAFQSVGVVDEEIYREAMLLEGKAAEYEFELDTGEAVVLSNIHVSYDYQETKEGCEEQIRIKAEAVLQNASITDAKMQQEFQTQIQEYLDPLITVNAMDMKRDKNLDISNGFYRLGGYQRKLYQKYDKPSLFLKDLNYEIIFSITPVIE